MKKLIIAVAVVCAAALAQAATVSWGSGALYTAAGKDGGWGTTMVNAAGVAVTMNVYLVDAATFATVAAMDQKGIYQWAADKTANYTAQNKNASTGALIGAATASTTELAASTTYYSVITAEYTDTTYGDMYMATTKSFATTSAGAGSANNLFGGTTGVKNWTAAAVPEPTSGLLLLLGMAGLALRRKQA